MIRCKACGYVMKEKKLADRCPACGAPKNVFEPYSSPIAERRRRILGLHLHPMAVHFPTSFAVAILVFSLAIPFFPGEGQRMLVSTTKVLVLFMPLLVIITFAVGWWDGVVRFRKISNSHILKRKILYAVSLFVVSSVLVPVVWAGAFTTPFMTLTAILLGAVAVIFSILLGLLGTSITEAAFPGK